MPRRQLRYPHDIATFDIPAESMESAKLEVYRFLFNYWVWKGDLHYLCAICYLQGAFDGAQVALTNKEVSDALQSQ
jgi:hypothetical protein